MRCHRIEVPSKDKFQMETLFWNIISTEINIPVNIPNGINGIEYLFKQERIFI